MPNRLLLCAMILGLWTVTTTANAQSQTNGTGQVGGAGAPTSPSAWAQADDSSALQLELQTRQRSWTCYNSNDPSKPTPLTTLWYEDKGGDMFFGGNGSLRAQRRSLPSGSLHYQLKSSRNNFSRKEDIVTKSDGTIRTIRRTACKHGSCSSTFCFDKTKLPYQLKGRLQFWDIAKIVSQSGPQQTFIVRFANESLVALTGDEKNDLSTPVAKILEMQRATAICRLIGFSAATGFILEKFGAPARGYLLDKGNFVFLNRLNESTLFPLPNRGETFHSVSCSNSL